MNPTQRAAELRLDRALGELHGVGPAADLADRIAHLATETAPPLRATRTPLDSHQQAEPASGMGNPRRPNRARCIPAAALAAAGIAVVLWAALGPDLRDANRIASPQLVASFN